MVPSALSFYLSRAAAAAAVIFLFASWRSLQLNPKGVPNRLAALFNILFALWAGAAMFWYAAETKELAHWWYTRFSWCWSFFPPLVLHFLILVSRTTSPSGKKLKLPFLLLLYAPATLLLFITPTRVLDLPQFQAGYWMLTVQESWQYYFFISHYILYTLAGIVVVHLAARRCRNRDERTRLLIIAWTLTAALLLGFITDSFFLIAGIEFPNMAIFWILILSIGMLTAMNRFGFLSPLPLSETPRILNALADMVLFLDGTGTIAWANKSCLEGTGCNDLKEIRGSSIDRFIDRKNASMVEQTALGSLDMHLCTTAWGHQRIPVTVRSRSLVDLNQSHGAIVTAMDMRTLHALEKAERDAADSGLLLNEFIDHSLDGIVLTDSSGNIRAWNAPMVTMTGLSAEKAPGSKIWEILAGDEESFSAALRGEPSPWTNKILEKTIIRPDGERKIIQCSSFIIPLGTGAVSATISRDISESRRAAEETIERIRKLDHAQKMDAIGSLTSGIAHDFNNTLGGLVGSLSIIKAGREDGSCTRIEDIAHELDLMDQATSRATASVERLLALAKKRVPGTETFRLEEILGRVAAFADRSMDSSVSLSLPDHFADAFTSGDPGLIEQLLLNIFINAEHSMTFMQPDQRKRGGTIRVAMERFTPDRNCLTVNPSAEDRDYWCLAIKDEGVGIPHHILPHIFDPFYSTKPSEKANGLGLAMVHSIITQHGGFIDVSTEIGQGSTFYLYLPAAEPAGIHPKPESPVTKRKGTILLVDDDEMVRDTVRRMIISLGYQAETAASAEEALDLFADKPDKWVSVVMDNRMGGMSGSEAARHMRLIRADIPITLISGYVSDEALAMAEEEEGITFLQKPFTVRTLGSALEGRKPVEVG